MKMRKEMLFMIMLLGVAFGSCNEESDEFVDESEQLINLTAPNGQRIATNIEALTNLVAEVAEEKYGENKDVKIDNVIYYDTDHGFIAEIRYVTYDGHSSNLIMANIALDGHIGLKRRTREENEVTGGLTIYSCKNEDRDKCPDCGIAKTQNGVQCFCSKGDRSYCKLQERKK